MKLFVAEKPDIVFLANGKEYAIEVETGIAFDTNKKDLQEKVLMLNNQYGKRWFFVVADARYAYPYGKLGLTFTRKNVTKHIRLLCKGAKATKIDSEAQIGDSEDSEAKESTFFSRIGRWRTPWKNSVKRR